jgi:hypothetical protein
VAASSPAPARASHTRFMSCWTAAR